MIKMKLNNKETGRETFAIGLSAINMLRLARGNPIIFNLEDIGGQGELLIFTDETEQAAVQSLADNNLIPQEIANMMIADIDASARNAAEAAAANDSQAAASSTGEISSSAPPQDEMSITGSTDGEVVDTGSPADFQAEVAAPTPSPQAPIDEQPKESQAG